MGITKTEGFDPQVLHMSEVIKALGHPARLAIMEYLAKSPSCICSDIISELPLAQPTVSRHLSELKKVGLIKGEISGKNMCYCIDREGWNAVMEYFAQLSACMEAPTEKCNSSKNK
ncbi:ArsR/SmtB family transcription factor [Robertkochia flava]|uniref:ArsR/SmtB family transcription factor n=1 Tax=Robertkochia flava TaxID=3447986 RepID=UPI001CCAACE6|nr:metalloregulator ArsR/SmtB family transcription factor [Robertkochia marina]